MVKATRFIGLGFLLAVTSVGYGNQANAADRFEVTSIKAIRPTLVKTVAALRKGDVAAAKAAFGDYDSVYQDLSGSGGGYTPEILPQVASIRQRLRRMPTLYPIRPVSHEVETERLVILATVVIHLRLLVFDIGKVALVRQHIRHDEFQKANSRDNSAKDKTVQGRSRP